MFWQWSNALNYNLTSVLNVLRSTGRCINKKKKKLNNDLFSTCQTQTKHEFEILFILLMAREEALATDCNK